MSSMVTLVCRLSNWVVNPRFVILAGLLFIFSGRPALAQWKVEFAPEYFNWWEYINGRQAVHESGFRYGLELSYQQTRSLGWIWKAQGKIYAGSVDYHGETHDGVPVNATQEYYGALSELHYGYRRALGQTQYLDFMGGVGIEGWFRRPHEFWVPIYIKAGLELSPRTTGWLGSLGVKTSIYTVEWAAGAPGDGTFILHPRPEPSPYGEIGYQCSQRMSVVIFYDSYRFAKSSSVAATDQYSYFQPESKMSRIGVKAGWTF